jgi:beta-lactamase regulating signal transducer with metallopeptidase domain
MIASWMAYALVIASLVSVAALIAERIAILRRLPSRWAWVTALLASILLPVLFGARGAHSNQQPQAALVSLAKEERPPVYTLPPGAWVGIDTATRSQRVSLDTWLVVGWSAMSVCALAILAMGWIQLRRRLRSAVAAEVDGVRVTVTQDIGPAVIGIVRPRIVVPRWLLQADAATRASAIAHEQEHMRTQDIRVLGGSLLIALLFPWNLPVWWQLRRLRFAMEVDCDARVLRAGQSLATYSAVLLNVAARLVPLRAAAAGLSESGSWLEKRIRIMHAPLRRRWRLLAALLASCSVAPLVIAANVTAPSVANSSGDGLPLLPSPVATQTDDEAALARAVGYFYPQLMASSQAGRPYVWVIVNERGEVSQIDMDVRPSWDSEADFARNWQTYLREHGVLDAQARQEIVLQVPIGPNHVVLASAMVRGAVARDSAAPRFEIGPEQAPAMEARLLATADAQRRVIEHFDAAALNGGLPPGEELWFLIDPDGKVLHSGRRARITDPEQARRAMKVLFPDLSVGYVTRGTAVKDAMGNRVPVSWQWLERA